MSTLYHNGKVYLGLSQFASAFSVNDGLIEKVGNQVLLEGNYTNVVDLKGATVIPGLNDSHLHMANFGKLLNEVRLAGTTSITEVIERGKDFIRNNPLKENEVLTGRGWNQDYFAEGRMPNRYDLDEISKDIPIIFTRCCGHVCVANSKALEIAGINEDTIPNKGGVIYKDENGIVTGLIGETASDQIKCIINKPTPERIAEMLQDAMDYAIEHGLTSVQTCDINSETEGSDEWKDYKEAYEILYAKKPLNLRTYQQSTFYDTATFQRYLDEGCTTGSGNSFLKYGPLKLFVDGSLGARTALLAQDYNDQPGNKGVETITKEKLHELVSYAYNHNCSVCTHAIGNQAIKNVLDCYNEIIDDNNSLRLAINHVQITDEQLLKEFTYKNIYAQVQPIFIQYDMNIVEDRVGKQLATSSYNFKTLYDNNVHVSFGTDAPVEDLNPFENIYSAVTRKSFDGTKEYLPSEKFTVEQAIDCYTYQSACVSFEENVKGLIKPGYYADFIVLDRDIFTVDESDIKSTKVLKTVIAGETVYSK